MDSNSLHGPVRELHWDNGISNEINRWRVGAIHHQLMEVHTNSIPDSECIRFDHAGTWRGCEFRLSVTSLSRDSSYGHRQ
jgi:hypothetical protein